MTETALQDIRNELDAKGIDWRLNCPNERDECPENTSCHVLIACPVCWMQYLKEAHA
jgi:hypothetical protein